MLIPHRLHLAVRVWDRFNNEEVSFVAVVDPLHTLYDTSQYFAVTGSLSQSLSLVCRRSVLLSALSTSLITNEITRQRRGLQLEFD